MLHNFSLGLVLFATWLLLSGHFEPLLIGLGIVSVLLVLYISHRMDVIDREGHPIHLGPRVFTYFPWLIWEIIKANIDVTRIILKRDMPISPTLFYVKGSQQSELGQVIYGNSITLTPGTITVDIVDGQLEIHALTRAAADELEKGEMDMRATRMEGMKEQSQ